MAFKIKSCSHLDHVDIRFSTIDAQCKECVELGDTWVHLRLCVDCGNIGCCDSSKNKHATQHFKTHKHPVIVSAEPNEAWAWCYEDELFKKL